MKDKPTLQNKINSLVHDGLLNRNDGDLLRHMDDEVDGVDSMQAYLKK